MELRGVGWGLVGGGPRVLVRRSDEPTLLALWPRRTTFEATVVDLASTGGADELAALLHQALRERRSTVGRLRAEMARRGRHPQRRLMADLLEEAAGGSEGPLERRFVAGVLRRHGLLVGTGQLGAASVATSDSPGGLGALVASGSPSRDARRFDRGIAAYRVVFELDGDLHHRGARRVADRRKSNLAARHAWLLLRFGWAETVDTPCLSAVEIAVVLLERGWPGRPRPCGPGCAVADYLRRAG